MGTLARPTQQLAPISKRFEGTPLAEIDQIAIKYVLGMLPRHRVHPSWLSKRRPVSANLLGITTLDLPRGLPPDAAELVTRVRAQAEYNLVGEIGRSAIRQALQDTGIDRSEPWVYIAHGVVTRRGRRLLVRRFYKPWPDWPTPYDGLGGDDLGNVIAIHAVTEIDASESDYYRQFEGYRFDTFGMGVDPLAAEALGCPEQILVYSDWQTPAGPAMVASYRTRAFHDRSQAVAIGRWRPGQDFITKDFLGGVIGSDGERIVERGLELFYDIQARKPSMSNEDAFEQAVQFGLEWLQDNPGVEPSDFGLQQFTAKRVTGPDATKKWLSAKGFGIRQVQQEIARRLRRSR